MPKVQEEMNVATQVVHAGERRPVPNGLPVATPIYATATFTYDSMDQVDQVFAGEQPGYIYSRYGNPTVAALEEAIRVLEGGVGACAYSSGMAALHAATKQPRPVGAETRETPPIRPIGRWNGKPG